MIRMLRAGVRDSVHAEPVRKLPPVGGIDETLSWLRAEQSAAVVDMISASVKLLRYDGWLFPTKIAIAPNSILIVPVLTTNVSGLLPSIQGASTGAARSMHVPRAAERRAFLAPGAPAEFLLLPSCTPPVES